MEISRNFYPRHFNARVNFPTFLHFSNKKNIESVKNSGILDYDILEIYTNIWISIDATYSKLNKKGGEYKFHSILNSRPAYRNADNTYLAYNGYGGS